MRLREATALDAGKVGAILSGFIDETPWMPRLHSRAEDVAFCAQMIAQGWVRVAEVDGQVQGFLARRDDEVLALYVARGARRAGVGSTLLGDAQAATARLRLWTFQDNDGAQAFYAAHGFDEVGRTAGEANDEGLPDIEYLWERA